MTVCGYEDHDLRTQKVFVIMHILHRNHDQFLDEQTEFPNITRNTCNLIAATVKPENQGFAVFSWDQIVFTLYYLLVIAAKYDIL